MPLCRSRASSPVAKNMPLPGLSTVHSPVSGAGWSNNLITRLAANQDASHRSPHRRCAAPAVHAHILLADSQREIRAGETREYELPVWHAAAPVTVIGSTAGTISRSGATLLPSALPNPPGSIKSRCISIITSAQCAAIKQKSVWCCRYPYHMLLPRAVFPLPYSVLARRDPLSPPPSTA